MDTLTRVKTILILILLVCANINLLAGNDKLIEYALNLLSGQKVIILYDDSGKPVSALNTEVDSNYREIAKTYFLLGFQEEALGLIDKITQEGTRYQLLRELAYPGIEKQKGVKEIIAAQIKKNENEEYKVLIYQHLIASCLESDEKPKTTRLLEEWIECIENLEHSDIDNYEWAIGDSLDIVIPLIENGLNEWSEKLLKKVDDYINKQPHPILMQDLLGKYFQLNRMADAGKLIKKMKEYAGGSSEYLLQLAVYLIKLERYQEAEELLKKAFMLLKNDNQVEMALNIGGFLVLNYILENPVVFNLIEKQEEIRQLFEKCIITKKMSRADKLRQYPFYGMNDIIIEFYVKTGDYDKARDIAEKLDNIYDTAVHRDHYFYQMALLFEKSFDIEAVTLMGDKIKTRSLAVDTLLRAARLYRQSHEPGNFKRVMNKATTLLSRQKDKIYLFGDLGDVVLGWLEGGFFHEAYKTIEMEKDEDSRSELLFEMAQELVFQNRIAEAINIAEKITMENYKGLALSKIASRSWISGKEKEAVNYFKKAIRLAILDKSGYLSHTLQDYVTAKLHGRLNRTELWKNRYVVD